MRFQDKLRLLKGVEENKGLINVGWEHGEQRLHRPTGCQGSWCHGRRKRKVWLHFARDRLVSHFERALVGPEGKGGVRQCMWSVHVVACPRTPWPEHRVTLEMTSHFCKVIGEALGYKTEVHGAWSWMRLKV